MSYEDYVERRKNKKSKSYAEWKKERGIVEQPTLNTHARAQAAKADAGIALNTSKEKKSGASYDALDLLERAEKDYGYLGTSQKAMAMYSSGMKKYENLFGRDAAESLKAATTNYSPAAVGKYASDAAKTAVYSLAADVGRESKRRLVSGSAADNLKVTEWGGLERLEKAEEEKKKENYYGSVVTINGKTREERRQQYDEMNRELNDINDYIKRGQYGHKDIEEKEMSDRALYDPTYEGYLDNYELEEQAALREGRTVKKTPKLDVYFDADGRDTGRTYGERKDEIEAELRRYEMYDGAADRLISAVSKIAADAKAANGYISTTGQTVDDVDGLYKLTDDDFRKYYDKSDFAAWMMARSTFGNVEGVDRSLEKEGKASNHLEYLTDEEIRALTFVLKTEGPEAVDSALRGMQASLDRRAYEDERKTLREGSKRILSEPVAGAIVANLALGPGSPAAIAAMAAGAQMDPEDRGTLLTDVFESAASVPVSVASAPLAFADSLLQSMPDRDGIVRRNPYSTYQRPRRWAQAARSDVAQDIDNATGNASVFGIGLSDVYEAGMSAAESVLGSYVMGPGYSVVMGMGAASDEMNRLAEEGATPEQALVGGLLAGAAETAFEYISLERFTSKFINGNPSTWREYLKDVFLQGIAEGSEEVATELANTITNKAVMGSQSDWDRAVRSYRDAGMSEDEAYDRVFKDKVLDVWRAGAGGFLSGGMMGGAGAASVAQNKAAYRQFTRELGTTINEEGRGRALSKSAADIAAEVAGSTAKDLTRARERYEAKPTDRNAGRLYRAIEGAIEEGYSDSEARRSAAERTAVALTGERANYEKATYVGKGDDNGADVTVDRDAPIARIEGDNVIMNTNRGEVALSDLGYDSDSVRELIHAAAEYGAEHGNEILSNYGGEDVAAYVSGMREGILRGQYGDIGAELSDFNALSKGDRDVALEIGRAIRNERVAAEAATAKTATVAAFNARGRDLKTEYTAKNVGATGTKGTVRTVKNVEAKTSTEKANVEFVKAVAEMRGADYVIYDSAKDPELRTRNGFYSAPDGSIWVDLHSGEGRQGLVAYTLGHEMTHDARKWAPETFRTFTDFLISNYAEAGVSVDQLVKKKMAEMRTDDYDLALEDVVADACERFLLDRYAPEKLAALEQENPGIVRKIIDWIKSAIAKLKEAYQAMREGGTWEQSAASEALEAVGDKIDEIARAWGVTVDEAAWARKQAGETKETAGASPRPTENGADVKYSTRGGVTAEEDRRYLELAKDPEKNEAELSRMVERAARAAGYDSPKLYHGTDAFGFTSIDNAKADDKFSFWASNKENVSGSYTKSGKVKYISKAASKTWTERVTDAVKEFVNYVAEKYDRNYTNQTDTLLKSILEAEDDPWHDAEENYIEYELQGLTNSIYSEYVNDEKYDGYFDWLENSPEARIIQKLVDKIGEEHSDLGGVYQLYANTKNMLEVDARGAFWNGIFSKDLPEAEERERYGVPWTTREVAEWARKDGSYSGVIFRNIIDSATYSDVDTMFEQTDVYAFFNPQSQVKSADPVTYDEDGKVIPLSERFNPEKDDIRYSTRTTKKDDVTKSENFKRWFGDSKVVNEDGSPKVMYHGTRADFTTFDKAKSKPGYYGRGFYFTSEKSQADVYGKTVDAYLKIENPLSPGETKISEKQIRAFLKAVAENEDYSIENYGTYDVGEIAKKITSRDAFSVIQDVSATAIGDVGEAIELFNSVNGTRFDGVITPTEAVVYKPTQIKSASGNVGTYDEKTGDIYHSTRTGRSVSTRAVVERALETLKDGSAEKEALTKYKAVLDQIEEQRAELEAAAAARAAGREKEARSLETAAKNRIATLSARLRKMEDAPALQNVTAVGDVAALNEDVRKLSQLLRLQGKQTGGAIALKSSIEGVASELMKEHGIRRGKTELVELLEGFYRDMTRETNRESLNREYMLSMARPVAEWLVNGEPTNAEIDQSVNDVLNYLKGHRIRVNENQKGDIKHRYDGDFNKWRRSLMGYITVTNDADAMPLDDLWNDLSQEFPMFFPADVSDADQGVMLADILADLKANRVTEYVEGEEELGWLYDTAAAEVAEAFWRIKPYETVADKYERQIRELKASHDIRNVGKIIKEEREKIWRRGYDVARQRQQRAEYKKKIRTLAENMSTRLLNPKQNKYIPESLRAATAKVLDALDFDTGRSASLSERFAQLKSQYEKIIEKEKEGAGKNPITSEDETVKSAIDNAVLLLKERVAETAVKDMTPAQLDAVYIALKAFNHTIKNELESEEMKTLLDEKLTVTELGERLIRETGQIRERKGILSKYINAQMRPSEFLETLAGYKKGSLWSRVYQMLDNAQRKQIMYEMQGNDMFRKILEDKEYVKKLSSMKDGDLVTIYGMLDRDGKPFRVTRGMMLSIYKHLQNEENIRHIMIGGLVAPDLKKYYAGKTENVYDDDEGSRGLIPGLAGAELAAAYRNVEKKVADLDDRWDAAYIRGDAETMDEVAKLRDDAWREYNEVFDKVRGEVDTIKRSIEKQLTDKDRAFLDTATEFFDGFSREILNEASKRMYGFEKARVENYFPIHVSPDFLTANFEQIKHDFSVEGMGFMKDRIKSNKPIMLEDFGAVIDRQISNVAKYAALAPALRDFAKIYSVSTGGEDAQYSTSVRRKIENRLGDQGVEYLEDLIADLNGARGQKKRSRLDALRSRGAGAVLTMNPRVSFVQAASYATAAAELNYSSLARALVNPEGKSIVLKKADTDLIKKYTALLWSRKEGNLDASVAAMKEGNNKRKLAAEKFRFLTGWIEAVDSATVGRLWYASERYVEQKNKQYKGVKQSGDQAKIDEYYTKVAEVFSNVVEKTQPNYSVMQRPAILRSPSSMTKALTMFMTQRLQNANILYGAARRFAKYTQDYRAGANGVTKADVKEAGGQLYRAVSSQILSAGVIAGMRLVSDVIMRNMKGRRDKDEDVTPESVGWSVLNEFLSSVISNFVGGSEIYEAVRAIISRGNYYGITAGGLSQINEFVSDVVTLCQKIGSGKVNGKDLVSLAGDLATVAGIPLGNAVKIMNAIKGWALSFAKSENVQNDNLFEYGEGGLFDLGPVERTNKQRADLMLRAYRDGNDNRLYEIRGQYEPSSDKSASEVADEAFIDAVYDEWSAGRMDDREALDALEKCLAAPPRTENDERIRIEKWETKKDNEGKPKDEQTSYSQYTDLRETLVAYVNAGKDEKIDAGRKAEAMIEQYRAWGYKNDKIQEQITTAIKPIYDGMSEKEKDSAAGYIATLFTFAGKDYDAAYKQVKNWKPKEEEEEDE